MWYDVVLSHTVPLYLCLQSALASCVHCVVSLKLIPYSWYKLTYLFTYVMLPHYFGKIWIVVTMTLSIAVTYYHCTNQKISSFSHSHCPAEPKYYSRHSQLPPLFQPHRPEVMDFTFNFLNCFGSIFMDQIGQNVIKPGINFFQCSAAAVRR